MDKPIKAKVRTASPRDLSPVLGVDHLREELKRQRDVRQAIEEDRCWLAEADGQVVGYAVVDECFFGNAFIRLIVVAAPFRRRGIGTALMRNVESIFVGRKLFTSTNESNVASQRLMESRGFRRSGAIQNLDEGDPEIVYFKPVEVTPESN